MGGGEGPAAAHRIGLHGPWGIWRTAALRGTGFPYGRLDPLVAPETAAAVRRAAVMGQARDAACQRLRADCVAHLATPDESERRLLQKAIRRLRRGALPARLPAVPRLQRGLAALRDAGAGAEEALAALRRCYEGAWDQALAALEEAAREPRFRAALGWQNPRVLETAVAPLLRRPAGRLVAEDRKHALLIARYLQRYCAKNETIGFFGPLAWATLDDGPLALDCAAAGGTSGHCTTRFEHWAIDGLSDTLAADPALREWLAPRLAPTWRLEPHGITGPGGQVVAITEPQHRVLSLMDGATAARDLPGLLGLAGAGAVAELMAFIGLLADGGLVIWRPVLPVAPGAEGRLRTLLETVGDDGLRRRLTAPLEELEAGRRRLDAATGGTEFEVALAALDQAYQAVTGRSPRRAPGAEAAGRGLVYRDCVRDLRCRLGRDFRTRLGPPLALVLASARWFTWRLVRQYGELVEGLYAACCAERGEFTVPLERLWLRLQAEGETLSLVVDDVVEQVTERWASLMLGGGAGGGPRCFAVADLAAGVEAAFDAPGPGWPGARYHSPDVLIAASDMAAVQAGRYTLVLGELHASGNSLLQQTFLDLHPDPGTLLAAVEVDQPEPELVAAVSRHRLGQRGVYDPATPHDFHFEYDDTPSWRPRRQVFRIADLVVERGREGLRVRSRDGAHDFPAIAFFGPQLRGFCARRFRLLAPAAHLPRVTIGDLVVVRESWRFAAAELAFAVAPDAVARYAGLWRLALDHGLPRWLFMAVSGEKKPVHLDLHSPVLSELASRFIRAARREDGWVSFTEMLPAPGDLWLADEEGGRYSCELRFAVLDGRGHAPAGGGL